MALATSGYLTVIMLDTDESNVLRQAVRQVLDEMEAIDGPESPFYTTLDSLYWEIW